MTTTTTNSKVAIPFNDLQAAYIAYKPALDDAVQRVLSGGWYILGDEVAAFEQEFAAFTATTGCVAVNSGTDALQIALRACDIGPGDEVITVSHTAVATVAAIELVGATAVLVDIDPVTYTIDPNAVALAITPRTRAVIAVHLYGQPAELEPLLQLCDRHKLLLIEDCAQAHGATWRGRAVGSVGDVGCFSFYPTKNLAAMGDGGAIVSRHAAIIERARLVREYGWVAGQRYVSQVAGMNSRLDELQAAILRVRLPLLGAENATRVGLAARYDALLPVALKRPTVAQDVAHVFHLYVVRTGDVAGLRDRLRAELGTSGIITAIHYPVPIHLQPAYVGGNVISHDLSVTERVARQILSLPMHPFLSEQQVETVARTLATLLP